MSWRCGLILTVFLFTPTARFWAEAPGTNPCKECHEDEVKAIQASAHGSVSCADCHARHEHFPHPKRIPKPKCSQCHAKETNEHAHSVHGLEIAKGNDKAPRCQDCHGGAHELKTTTSWEFKKSIPQTCAACHGDIYNRYHTSVHGQAVDQGVLEAPVCTSCHHAHSIQPPSNPESAVFPGQIAETCGRCHGSVALARQFNLPADRLLSYQASFHGLLGKQGSEIVANCASCHGTHLILAGTDPRSSINPKNLPKTCGKCHPGAGRRFAIGPVHELPGFTEPAAVLWVRTFYSIAIPILVGLMILHNLGDWLRKLIALRLRQDASSAAYTPVPATAVPVVTNEQRMYLFERVEHILLLISFTALTWTGFALKYPDGWWARPLLAWGPELRDLIHRLAAVVFIAVIAIHIFSLIVSPRLRAHWKELLPRFIDLREALQNFAYNLGLRQSQPGRSSHSYVEKSEYWAVVWGAAIMTITGLMLWAHNLFLAWLPKVFLDVATSIHFYEAVLAALAIPVWHLSFVVFDPEVYPMDPAWLTGHSVRRRQPNQQAAAADEGTAFGKRLDGKKGNDGPNSADGPGVADT